MRVHWPAPVLLGCIIALFAGGCGPDEIIEPREDEDAGTDTGDQDTGGGGDDTGTPDATPDTGDDDTGVEPNDCTAWEHQGQVWNCTELDRCDLENLSFRIACCDCDPALCEPDPNCNTDECTVDADCGQGFTCQDGTCIPDPDERAESCMMCHNGATEANDYSGSGLENPHPFPGAPYIRCTGCHGGDGEGAGKTGSHVPAPPSIGDRQRQVQDPAAWFNRLTLTGIDKLEPANYTSPDHGGKSFNNLDYLQFVNPGDLRVVGDGRSCGMGGCHGNEHGQWVERSILATATGFFSGWRYANGIENRIPEYRGRNMDGDTLAGSAPRATQNPAYQNATRQTGEVGRLVEQPELAGFQGSMRDNAIYDADTLANHVINADQDPQRPGRVRTGSPLDTLLDECTNIVCGDCHLNSAGANNRYADFRSSGCTSCHMEYSYDGRSRSGDPNINRLEPVNPDAIAAPERPHVERHSIRNVARTLPNGTFQRGITDRACVGCHQGSNRTVLQFWGIRLDQNQDVTNGFQYPANPVTFTDTAANDRLYDPAVQNETFNGRVAAQHLELEDYDGDNRDDTPADIHFEAGMGCIDCHGSWDLHGGTRGAVDSGKIWSRRDQQVATACESCHGNIDDYTQTEPCTTYDGEQADCATDRRGNALRHVTRDANGDIWLRSRVTGQRHYVTQTKDVVYQNNKRNPLTSRLIWSQAGSFAMGRNDGNIQTGNGPIQENPALNSLGFSHTDKLDCVACHGSWTNNCVGCHLKPIYDANPANFQFSNITGERILLNLANADFIYQTPVPFYLGVGNSGKVTQISPAGRFFRWEDRNAVESAVFGFSDRQGHGNNPTGAGRNAFPGLNHYLVATHAIRGKVDNRNEGPRYCVACHLTQDGIDNFGDEYAAFVDAYANNDFANLDFDLLQEHIGQNTGNQLDSPLWVHMASGRGSGLFLFDATGCPVNPLDANANRQYCPDGAPADNFDPNNVVYDLDRLVELNGVPNVSSTHPMRTNQPAVPRTGAPNAEIAGPLGAVTLQRLTDPNVGIVLDTWLDADAAPHGNLP